MGTVGCGNHRKVPVRVDTEGLFACFLNQTKVA